VGDGPERRNYGLDIFFRKEALGIENLGEEWVGYIVMALVHEVDEQEKEQGHVSMIMLAL
jgi:hypothetical protein